MITNFICLRTMNRKNIINDAFHNHMIKFQYPQEKKKCFPLKISASHRKSLKASAHRRRLNLTTHPHKKTPACVSSCSLKRSYRNLYFFAHYQSACYNLMTCRVLFIAALATKRKLFIQKLLFIINQCLLKNFWYFLIFFEILKVNFDAFTPILKNVCNQFVEC